MRKIASPRIQLHDDDHRRGGVYLFLEKGLNGIGVAGIRRRRASCRASKAARRRKALAAMAQLVGAIVLARAVDDASLSDEILAAAKTELLSN